MNPTENIELQLQVDELLRKDLVRENMNYCAVPALFVSKKDGSFRMCMDSKATNKLTIKYHFPILRPDDMLVLVCSQKLILEVNTTIFV
jgi:hypothetical protein